MDANKADFPIRFMADRLDVSTSGFYEWRHRQVSLCRRAREDAELTKTICEIHKRSRGTYGSPRVWADLRLGSGVRVGRKRVERLMRQAGIQGVIRRRKGQTTRRNPYAVPSDDLVNRVFTVDGPDRLWVADITEHPTAEGKVYLAAVLDVWNRECIGWSITDHLKAEIVCDAFDMATWRRRPDPDSGLTHHADHGTQYTSWIFGQRLRNAGILGSMGSVGDALDNAMAESFFATLQVELLDRKTWTTRGELAQAIFEYIEAFYNPERRHSRLDYLSPVQYRQRHHTAPAAVA
jgi:transposase InsO family protein